jgi:RNA ligase
MKINKENLEALIDNGMILANKHKKYPITILNYSKIAQYQKNWNPLTIICRGLIIDEDYNTVAIPFVKFFNIEEIKKEEIPNESFEVYKKMDGSLGILFYYDGKWHMASRGSFTSEQAIKGQEIFEKKYSDAIAGLNPDFTYLFEIIFPENQIVVNYGNTEDIILLGAINKNTGEELSIDEINLPLNKVEKVNPSTFDNLKNKNLKNEEGYVIRFLPSNFRFKIKFQEYIDLHGIVTEFSSKKVWEILKNGSDLETILEIVPDEYYDKVRVIYDDLKNRFDSIKAESIAASIEAKKFANRKDLALWLLKDHKSVMNFVFYLLDNKEIDDAIWKSIKPEFKKI